MGGEFSFPWGILMVITWTTATMSLGGYMGYEAGVAYGEESTLQEVVKTCLKDTPPPFCMAMLEALDNQTSQPTTESGNVA